MTEECDSGDDVKIPTKREWIKNLEEKREKNRQEKAMKIWRKMQTYGGGIELADMEGTIAKEPDQATVNLKERESPNNLVTGLEGANKESEDDGKEDVPTRGEIEAARLHMTRPRTPRPY